MKSVRADVATAPLAGSRSASRWADYVALAKPRLNVLVVATSAAGYYLGAIATPDPVAMLIVVVGTGLVAGGAAALNQVYERDTDALMTRTRMRPLPDGRLTPMDGALFGLALSCGGLVLLAARANLLSAMLALVTLVTYILVYTPMKRRSASATLMGAVPGALPALIGWAASRGDLSVEGWTLFAIVFLWQVPHFMAIAWMFREDYRRAGFPMLPVLDPEGRQTGRQAVAYAAALLPASLMPTFVHISGSFYFVVALALGIPLLGLAVRFGKERTDDAARLLFLATIAYLPLVWIAMILDKR